MERLLSAYWPNIISVFSEFKEIARVEQVQVGELWKAIDDLLKEKFLDSNTGIGASRWESILEIIPKSTDSLEIRNLRIRAKLLEDIPYTEESLRRMLVQLCGDDRFSMVLRNSEYTLVIRLNLKIKGLAQEVTHLCEKVVPLNIILDISVLYNTHKVLSAYRHVFLSKFSHKECREEELDEYWNSHIMSVYSHDSLENFTYDELAEFIEGE